MGTRGPGLCLSCDWGKQAEEEVVAAAAAGDRAALDQLFEQHSPMVTGIARSLHGGRGSESLEDLIQVGMVGLMEAIDRFDPAKGKFAVFAATTVSGVIKRHFRDRSRLLRVPRSIHDNTMLLRRATRELEGRLGRAPTEEELTDATGLERNDLREAQNVGSFARPRSLQAPIGEDEGELGERVGAEDPGLEGAERRAMISRLSARLDSEDRELLVRTFGLGQSQVKIASQLGGSQMRISRRLRKVFEAMEQEARLVNPVP